MALSASGIPFNYYLKADDPIDRMPLLKLHGSINWGLDAQDNIAALRLGLIQFRGLEFLKHVYYDIGDKLTEFDSNLRGPPVIVPPTWNKLDEQLAPVWAKAAAELETAENIVIVGYSLPETASFFRYLYALGTESKTLLRNFLVIDPEFKGEGVERRFKDMIGRGIEHRFVYVPSDFSTGTTTIQALLERV